MTTLHPNTYTRYLRTRGVFLAVIVIVGALSMLAWNANSGGIGIGGALAAERKGTGLPLPRFVSLRAGEVNLRAGPGVQYPVEWVYSRQNLPVIIIAEFDTWRKVRDWVGEEGWVHQSMLGSRRTVIVTGGTNTLRARADARSLAVARIEETVIGTLLSCPDGNIWCEIEIDGYKGWLRRGEFWGVERGEVVN